jgi:hypothetical protein
MKQINVLHVTNFPKSDIYKRQLQLLQLANSNNKLQDFFVKIGLGRFIFPDIVVKEPVTIEVSVKQELDLQTYGELITYGKRYIL